MLLYGSGSSAFVIVFIAVVILKGIALILIVKDVELGQTLRKHKESHGNLLLVAMVPCSM